MNDSDGVPRGNGALPPKLDMPRILPPPGIFPDEQPSSFNQTENFQKICPKLTLPLVGETWQNYHTKRIYTILNVEDTTIVMQTPEEPPIHITLNLLNLQWTKFNPKIAMDSPPQNGEIWQNIHSGKKASISQITDKEVIWNIKGLEHRTDLRSFTNNWKRIKTTDKWFVGSLLENK